MIISVAPILWRAKFDRPWIAGRIVKTLHLLADIDDEACRRRILTHLNRGAGRHQLARVVFHGKRGDSADTKSRWGDLGVTP